MATQTATQTKTSTQTRTSTPTQTPAACVTPNSIIVCTVATNDTTCKSVAVSAGLGGFVMFPNANPTAETRVNFRVDP